MVEQTSTAELRSQRRREYLGHLAHRYARWADDSAVYLTVGDTTWGTLERVVPEVDA